MPLGLDVGVDDDLFALARLARVVERRRGSPGGDVDCRSAVSAVSGVSRVDGRRGHAALDAVLKTFDGATVVPPVALPHGNAHVGLLRAALDLVDNAVAQHVEVCHARFGVYVLGGEVRDDFGVLFLAQPLVRVEHHIAVVLTTGGFLGGAGSEIGHAPSVGGRESENSPSLLGVFRVNCHG